MAEPDTTYFNLKRLHMVFAVASLALLAATVWMVVADHCRQWKRFQRTFRDEVEPWFTEARIRQEQSVQTPTDHRAAADRLERTLAQQRPSRVKQLLRLPGIDAFGRSLSIEQIWLPELTIDYNFRQVARFDRCMSCHQGIDKTAPGSPSEPAYRGDSRVTAQLATPAKGPQAAVGQGSATEPDLDRLYGLALAPRGILDPKAATIELVRPRTAAAQADLQVGDVIECIDDAVVASRDEAITRLTAPAKWGEPLRLLVRRGLPHPYSSHPRLDLFVGSHSPHPAATFGCTICHEGQGSGAEFAFASHTPNTPADGARWTRNHGWFRNADWDLPMRPKRFVQSSCLKCHHDVTDLEPNARFRDPPAAKLVSGYQLVRQYGCFGCHEIKGVSESQARTGPDMRLQPSGTMRKVAPSLRNASGKLAAPFIESWLRRPSGFRPNTRMPQFFGLHEHLDGRTLENTRRLEAVEIRAVTEFLLAGSQALTPLPAPAGVTESPSAERGKRLFQLHGCLACHKHADFPQGQSTVGPDLSRLGAKLNTEQGRKWLIDWIRDPLRHGPQTVMPNPLLEPVVLAEEEADKGATKPAATKPAEPRRSDPAADLAAYLLASAGWQAEASPAVSEADIDELALVSLSKTFPKQLAEQYVREGIPESVADQVRGDSRELVGKMTLAKKLRYVGRQTIRKRGCYGCHDIATFQDAALIAPALSDWGRKQTSLLAFERVNQFVTKTNDSNSARVAAGLAPCGSSIPRDKSQSTGDRDATLSFFRDALLSHRREGFLWQKLRAPRSFDYQKADSKSFNEQLLMGRFSLDDDQIEAIMTFVLGLVSQAPAEKYVHRPAARVRAIVEGRKVLDKYACAQCHTLEMERWRFQYDPAKFAPAKPVSDYAFLKPQITDEQLAASRAVDRRGLGIAEVVGMARVDAKGKPVEEEDEDGNPVYFFDLWEPAAINGAVWPVGGAQVPIAKSQLLGVTAPLGGALARLLYPLALADAKASGSTAAEAEAWGWVPPSLAHEGKKVQPAWLHDYLLSPTAIRPAAVLRMPKYNLSSDEAGELVNYFAAVSGADFPYTTTSPSARGSATAASSPRLDSALRILVDRKTFCGKCHLIGDYSPGGQIQTTLAPNLEVVGRRMRPEYLRRWLANPKSVLPYTAMPVNFPPTGEPLGQDLYRAPSAEQLDALVELLLNYDQYMGRRTSVQKLSEEAGKK